MSKIAEIIDGWKHYIFRDDSIEALARERTEICRVCPELRGLKCGVCGCLISAKVRSRKSKCPINKW